MNIIHSTHETCIAVPNSLESSSDIEVWLASMSDSGWRILTDFRNWPDWIPGLTSAKQTGSEPPARGTKLEVYIGHRAGNCMLDRWDPPRNLQVSINCAHSEMAYGFLLESNPTEGQLRISIELERSLVGLPRFAKFFFNWRLQRLGKETLSNLVIRIQLTKSLQG